MISPFLQLCIVYGGLLFIGIITGLLLKASLTTRMQHQIRHCHEELVKCNNLNVQLTLDNERLQTTDQLPQ